jgi:hypothetical protein
MLAARQKLKDVAEPSLEREAVLYLAVSAAASPAVLPFCRTLNFRQWLNRVWLCPL